MMQYMVPLKFLNWPLQLQLVQQRFPWEIRIFFTSSTYIFSVLKRKLYKYSPNESCLNIVKTYYLYLYLYAISLQINCSWFLHVITPYWLNLLGSDLSPKFIVENRSSRSQMYLESCSYKFCNTHGKTTVLESLKKVKKDSKTDIFLWLLRNF